MKEPLVIFLSAVSREFHLADPADPARFHSYRETLAESLRAIRQPHHIVTRRDVLQRLDPRSAPGHLAVISQENLAQGPADLLTTLEREVSAATLVIHLVGDMAGALPTAAERAALHARHPGFPAGHPELRDHLHPGDDITYTQWELWLAYHHQRPRLVFTARENAPRSPHAAVTPEEKTRQQRHLQRIQHTGEHTTPFADAADLVSQTTRALIREGRLDPPGAPPPDPAALHAARASLDKIVPEILASLKKPDRARLILPDRAGIALWIAALDTAAAAHELDRRSLLALLEENLAPLLENAAASTDPALHLELARAWLALGEYPAAIHAAEAALLLLPGDQNDDETDTALSAHQLIHSAAAARHDTARAIRALREGGALIDKDRHPLLWADYHTPLAEFLIQQAHWQEADDLLSDILDIREEHAATHPAELAGALLMWSNLLLHTAKYQGAHDVARRAAEIFGALSPPNVASLAKAWSNQGMALHETGHYAEAEPLMRRALAIDEASCGPEHPSVARNLNNLATLLQATNRLAEAEPLMRRALGIDEASFGPEHPLVAIRLNNLATLLQATNRLAEAEPLMEREVSIFEKAYGVEHPNVAAALNNLAQLLQATNRLEEAEPLMHRALEIDEASYGPEHPIVAIRLSNLAQLLQATNRLAEAEPLMRRALGIDEASFGPEHPQLAIDLNNLAVLLQATNRLAEAEPLMRRVLVINEISYGPAHPAVAIGLNNLAALLHATNRLEEAESLMRRHLLIFLLFTRRTGHPHPRLEAAMGNYHHLLNEMGLTEEAIKQRMAELLAEAGAAPA